MADGTTKAVETLRIGDVVASRDPATGQDMPEPVVKTVARTQVFNSRVQGNHAYFAGWRKFALPASANVTPALSVTMKGNV